MANRHMIILAPGADGEGVLAYVPALQLLAESSDEQTALSDVLEQIEDFTQNTRNATPPYSVDDFLRDEIRTRLRDYERQSIESATADVPTDDELRLLGQALLRITGR